MAAYQAYCCELRAPRALCKRLCVGTSSTTILARVCAREACRLPTARARSESIVINVKSSYSGVCRSDQLVPATPSIPSNGERDRA